MASFTISRLITKDKLSFIPKEIIHFFNIDYGNPNHKSILEIPLDMNCSDIEELRREFGLYDSIKDLKINQSNLSSNANKILDIISLIGLKSFVIEHIDEYGDYPPLEYIQFVVKNETIIKESINSNTNSDGYTHSEIHLNYESAPLTYKSYGAALELYNHDAYPTYYVIEVQSTGPIPGNYHMISFSAVKVDDALNCTFFGKINPYTEILDTNKTADLTDHKTSLLEKFFSRRKYNRNSRKIKHEPVFQNALYGFRNFSDDSIKGYPNAKETMSEFAAWIKINSTGKPIFVCPNNGFDYKFVSYYFQKYLRYNPFAGNPGNNEYNNSSINISDLYKGQKNDLSADWKELRGLDYDDPIESVILSAKTFKSIISKFK